MHRFLILTVLLANTLMALAQNGLKGRVVEADGTPVMYAAVMLDSGKKTEAGVMTEKDGTFLMKGTFQGKYILKVSSIGYKTLKRELACPGSGMMDVGDIILEEDRSVIRLGD
ncbi:MAG: carboxypeptidase regulatory-like domain-containing protein [Bacteroidales bacterium]|nr:carboxypeptidase regulatory-like domain-containing protein [Bacteroidales bacterium]